MVDTFALRHSPSPLPTISGPGPESESASHARARHLSRALLDAERSVSIHALSRGPENGIYNICTAPESGDKYLDLEFGNTSEGTSILAWPFSGVCNRNQMVSCNRRE